MTSALKLLTIVWNNGAKDSWGRINHSMKNALSLAIGSGLEFKASDFRVMAGRFRDGYWTGDGEWIYTSAIENGNASCIKAYEQYKGRESFVANNVSSPRNSCGGYIHASTITRQRERLAVGFGFPLLGRQWRVTGFKPGIVKIASYKKRWPEGKPVRLMQLTHDQCEQHFPSPAKFKKQSVKLLKELQERIAEYGSLEKATPWLKRKCGKTIRFKGLLTEADYKTLCNNPTGKTEQVET